MADASGQSARTDPTVYGGKWADRDLFPLDADVTIYWPDVRPCYDALRLGDN